MTKDLVEKTRKPRTTPYPTGLKGPKAPKKAYKSSAKDISTKKQNLTLGDWLDVFSFVDAHPGMGQQKICAHFATRPMKDGGALIFDQSTLSKNLKPACRKELEERAKSTANALSTKRMRVVTCPQVERALFLWAKSMEERGETVNGAMLIEKRRHFEELLKIPQEQRLKSNGWVASFCKTYGIRKIRRHGEAGSVDLEAVEAERQRLAPILAKFDADDIFNGDETGLFIFATPDRGLATQQMSGKKQSKFRITLFFIVNSSGTEKLPIFYIGKAKCPRAFGKKEPNQRGFEYASNKKAWMTSELFEGWLKRFDRQMRRQHRHVLLLLDNFSGHACGYSPTNVTVEFFEPNMTSFIQPLDAGIIRCFKALYRRALCLRAIDRDEAGELDIYKLNILEAMILAKESWQEVTDTTIKNCWRHTKILPSNPPQPQPEQSTQQPPKSIPTPSSQLTLDPKGITVLHKLATGDLTLPQAEEELQSPFGEDFSRMWQDGLNAAMVDEDNDTCLKAVEAFVQSVNGKPVKPKRKGKGHLIPTKATPIQMQTAEQDLEQALGDLKNRRRIHGAVPTVSDLIDDPEENEIGESPYRFQSDEEIIAATQRQLDIERGKIIEVEDADADEDEAQPEFSDPEILDLCRKLELAAIQKMDAGMAIELPRLLRQFRVHVSQEMEAAKKQVTLDDLWVVEDRHDSSSDVEMGDVAGPSSRAV